jgi:hypothetical protein
MEKVLQHTRFTLPTKPMLVRAQKPSQRSIPRAILIAPGRRYGFASLSLIGGAKLKTIYMRRLQWH